MVLTIYMHKDYSVAVEEDGSILVQKGDWLSKYSAAIHNGDSTKTNEFGRMKHGVVEKIKGKDIEEGETIYHIPTYRAALAKNPKMRAKADAYKLINDYYVRRGQIAFKIISRYEVATGLRERIANPGKINQGRAGVCPAASLVHILAKDRPDVYARLVIDLYEKGVGRIGTWEIKPSSDLKNYTIPHRAIHPADWIPMASIRDSENAFFDYQAIYRDWHKSVDWLRKAFWGGGASIDELKSWLKNAGYTKIEQWPGNQSTRTNIKLASDFRGLSYKVILAVDAGVLYADWQTRQPIGRPNHVIVLTSRVTFQRIAGREHLSMSVFTWGEGARRVPLVGRQMPVDEFLKFYHGFVAAKF
jgi:hypothetical protein